MKIGIITFHFAVNQGAALQCYALQTYLEKNGHRVEIINYRPAYHATKYKGWKNPFVAAKSYWKRYKNKSLSSRLELTGHQFLSAILHSVKQTDKRKYLIFEEFNNTYLKQSKLYKSIGQLRANPPADDIYIAGSDQVWNSDFLDYEFDQAYFMRFGSVDTKRITYAVSLKETYTDEELAELIELCSGIDAICIRETNPTFEQRVNKPVTIGLDPTLLLDDSDYSKLEAERLFDEPYVFVYGFENAEGIRDAVLKVSREKNLKVINGSPNRIRNIDSDKQVFNYGPSEFLSYIRHADFVVTNSFHGTAFSIIYKKDFAIVPHSFRGKRMNELLEKLGLSERLWPVSDANLKKGIDFSLVDSKIVALRLISEGYLNENLQIIRCE